MENNQGGGSDNSLIVVGVMGLVVFGLGGILIYQMSKQNSNSSSGLQSFFTGGTPKTGTSGGYATTGALSTLQSQVSSLGSGLQNLINSTKKSSSSGSSGGGTGAGGSSGGGGGSAVNPQTPKTDQYGNVVGTTVDKSGSYIEKGDPSTLYNANGTVKGDLDSTTGMFVDKSGNVIATSDGTAVSSFDPTSGNYVEKGDPSTLYNEAGNAIGDLDSSTGMYVNSGGQVVGASDGAAVAQYDSQTGAYQEADGTWYGQDGTEYASYNTANGTYVEAGDPTTLYNNDGSVANDNYNGGSVGGDLAGGGTDQNNYDYGIDG